MGIIEEIGKMRQAGRSEQDISAVLKQRGFSDEEVSNLVSQTQIKEAIDSSAVPVPTPQAETQDYNQNTEYQTPYFGLRPTTEELGSPQMQQQYPQESIPVPSPMGMQEEYPPQEYSQQPPQEYPQEYQQPSQEGYDYGQQQYAPSSAISSDTITEIAEQVVMEKLSKITKNLEKTLDLKTTLDAKLFNLNERLQRIEKIIDRLQLSILQKVGEYVVNVSDLKKELVETQKSFTAISRAHHTSPSHSVSHHHPSHTEHPHKTHKTKHHP